MSAKTTSDGRSDAIFVISALDYISLLTQKDAAVKKKIPWSGCSPTRTVSVHAKLAKIVCLRSVGK
jgi:hypothetical protein